MSYEPTNWKTGDVVTSAKLNKLENGVANSGDILKVAVNYNEADGTNTMDKTFREIFTALSNGMIIILYQDGFIDGVDYNANSSLILTASTVYDETVLPKYQVHVFSISPDHDPMTQVSLFETRELDGYPVFVNN